MTIKDQARKIIVEQLNVNEGCFRTLIENDLIDIEACRNRLVRYEYSRLILLKEPINARYELASRFNVSEATIQSIIYRTCKK